MSLNINTISDKAQFTNHFSEPMIIPKNAEVSLPKSNLVLPIIVEPYATVPNITNLANNACSITIDGVNELLTWQEIFNAHVEMTNFNFSIDNIQAGAEVAYFGIYSFYPNDGTIWNCADQTPPHALSNKCKIPFNDILALAIGKKYKFYDVLPRKRYKQVNYMNTPKTGVIQTPLINATSGQFIDATLSSYAPQVLTEFGFDVVYAPRKMTFGTYTDPETLPTSMIWNAGDSLINWNRGGADQITSTNAGVNVAFASENASNFSIDPNGGWVGAIPTLITGKMAWGLSLVAPGGGEKFDPNFLAGAGTTCDDYINLIDIGFLYSNNAAGSDIVQIIDGKTNNSNYDGAGSVNPQIPNLQPPHLVNEWTTGGGEKHFISIKRGAIVNGTSEFIFTLYGGTTGSLEEADEILYVCKRTFPGGDYRPTLVALSDNIAGNDLNEWRYIPLSNQSREQGGYLNNILVDGEVGRYYQNSIVFEPEINEDIEASISFWDCWGCGDSIKAALTRGDNGSNIQVLGDNHLIKSWISKPNFNDLPTRYWLGVNNILDMYITNVNQVEPTRNNAFLTTLPQQLKVGLNNLDVKNFSGSFIGDTIFNTTGINRVIGTIPIDITIVNQTMLLSITYEPYNLVYKPINNPNPITINELQIEIFYNEFLSNIKKNINRLFGTINLEINIKQGYTPKKPSNGLLPY